MRKLVDHGLEPIAKILNLSLKDKMLPVDWKTAVISPIGNWINDFLTDRMQLVRVNISDPVTVLSGIPQRSVLVPILFVIFINDLPDAVNSMMYLFADDTELMKEIQSSQDVVVLQNDVSEMDYWSNTWLIKFNLEKCHILTFGKPNPFNNTYRLGNHILQRVEMEKDLGVSVNSNLSFENHKISKANQIVGLIRRSFALLDAELFRRLFIAYI